ncbi:histidine phosphatase family protein [uncultured Umboniibacter sp.]|uniref:histidine phosphatase family protein n=1 Tax=uncultured Umboniibacter sp. TaxID=1798917 RepID=UPI00262AF3F4|nr:histidine phosphatase family protein [uncultured Umboniibacter sp.]
MSSSTTVVDFLRHGACEGGEIFRGSTDVSLSELGWRQLREKTQENNGGWEQVIASPLVRCRRFAEEFAHTHALGFEVDERWREMSFGNWEGKLVKDVWKTDKAAAMAYFSDPVNCNEVGIEPMETLVARTQSAWQNLLDTHQGKRVLVVSHGGLIRVHLATILNLPLASIGQLHLPYAAISRIVHSHGPLGERSSVHFINGTVVNGGDALLS